MYLTNLLVLFGVLLVLEALAGFLMNIHLKNADTTAGPVSGSLDAGREVIECRIDEGSFYLTYYEIGEGPEEVDTQMYGAGNGEDGSIVGDATYGSSSTEKTTDLVAAYERAASISGNKVYTIIPNESGKVTMGFAGDILFDPGYAVFNSYRQRGSRLESVISEDLLAKMRGVDIMMINNEFPYSDRGTAQPNKTFTFRAATSSAPILQEMGVDIVSLANNHTFDYGETAFLDTMDTLDGIGMPYVGAGHNLEEAMEPAYYVAGDMVIGIVAATQIERINYPNTRGATQTSPGVLRCFPSTEQVTEAIRTAKENSDFVILFVHWGTESVVGIDRHQIAQAPQFAAAGADIIIGAHPHILQQIGYVDGVPVVYSLGNFWFNSRTLNTCMVELTLENGELSSLQFVPCLQSGCSVSLMHDDKALDLIRYMRSISPTAVIDDEGYVSPK